MALPLTAPDYDFLYLVPADAARSAVVTALAGVEYDALYRALECREPHRVIWQLETWLCPHIARAQVEARGFDVTDVQDECPDGPVYVRFAWPYADDTDWPARTYYPRPKDWDVWPWERAPQAPRTDAVAGPAGVVLCDLDTTPAAAVFPLVAGSAAPHTIRFGQRDLRVDRIVRAQSGVYARVDISTTARPMWHYIPLARGGEAA